MRSVWMVPLVAIALMVPTAVVLAAGDNGGFDGVVDSIESQYHVQATRIPLMGLASLVANKASHGGLSRVRVAEFEHFDADVDGRELERMVAAKLGAGWQRIIRNSEKRGREQTFIFACPDGERMKMFVVEKDGHELDVVEASVDPEHLGETIAKYDHGDKDADGDSN